MRAKRLGRGLSGLISNTKAPEGATGPSAAEERAKGAAPAAEPATEPAVEPTPGGPGDTQAPEAGGLALLVAPGGIARNPYQPRTKFDDGELLHLKDSIREHGILQPLVARRSAGGLELVAGERRLRAAIELGMDTVPVVVRDATDEQMQTWALVENLQRVDLNAIEKARAMRAMMQNFSITQEAAAARVGKARATIANLLRLLELPPVVQDMVMEDRINGGQARAILQVKGEAQRLALARDVVRRGLSVRKIEELARSRARANATVESAPNPYVRDVEDRLTRALSTQVKLKMKRRGGAIEIKFASSDELERLLAQLDSAG